MIEKPLKPAEFAEKKILEAILDATYPPGRSLPAERVFAGLLGVTRPTLRETLQRLSKEGWVTIQQGKPTRVNDYLENGGLGILSALARYGKNLSRDMVSHLLEVRTTLFPEIAGKAAANCPEKILSYLEPADRLEDLPDAYAEYDWGLQMLMVKAGRNPVFNMIFNDFTPLYQVLGKIYFQGETSRQASLAYYKDLIHALEEKQEIRPLVEKIMVYTQQRWNTL